MSHDFKSHHIDPQTASDRSFGLVFSGFFALLALLNFFSKLPPFIKSLLPASECPFIQAHPQLIGHGNSLGLLVISLLFLLLALIVPKLLFPLNWLWTKFGLLLHKIISPLVLGVLFLLVITPIGLLMRLFGADPLRLKLDPEASTYWIERTPPGPAPESLKDQF